MYTRPDRLRLALRSPQALQSLQRHDGETFPAAWAALPRHESWEDAYAATAAYVDSRLAQAEREDPAFERKPVVMCVAGPHGCLINTAAVKSSVDRLQFRRGPLKPDMSALFLEGDLLRDDIRQAVDHAERSGEAISTHFDRTKGGAPMSPHLAGIVNELGALHRTAARSDTPIRYLQPTDVSFGIQEGARQELCQIASIDRALRQGARDAVVVVGANHLASLQDWFASQCTFIGIAPLGLDTPRMRDAIAEREGAQRIGYCLDPANALAFRSDGAVLSAADFERLLREDRAASEARPTSAR